MCTLRPEEKTATPAQEFDKGDEWVHAGMQDAQEEAAREDWPQPVGFTNEEIASIMPVDPQCEDA
jgi:hypothetical protein